MRNCISRIFMIPTNLFALRKSLQKHTSSTSSFKKAAPRSCAHFFAECTRQSACPTITSSSRPVDFYANARELAASPLWMSTDLRWEFAFSLSDYSSLLISLFSSFSGLKKWTANCSPKTIFAMISAVKKSNFLKSLLPTPDQIHAETASALVIWSICQNHPKASKQISAP